MSPHIYPVIVGVGSMAQTLYNQDFCVSADSVVAQVETTRRVGLFAEIIKEY